MMHAANDFNLTYIARLTNECNSIFNLHVLRDKYV